MMKPRNPVRILGLATLFLAFTTPACGGGSGGAGPLGAGQGLVLVGFLQAGVDNLAINTTLEFSFSEPVDPTTVSPGSIQIREGPEFGRTARGTFRAAGSTVYFEPALPTDCALQTAGFLPGTRYRIVVQGFPEEFSIKNSKGQPLDRTTTYEVTMLPESSDGVLEDHKPGQAPTVVATRPSSGEAAATVEQGGEIVVEFSENLDPCSIRPDTVLVGVYEIGERDVFEGAPNGNLSGFVPAEDSAPGDPLTWGSDNATAVAPPQAIPAERILEQTTEATVLRIVPAFGELPDNALVVVHLTFNILDFGGQPLPATTFSFTTENRVAQTASTTIPFDAATPIDRAITTGDVDTARSPGLAQAWLLFAGDGDNGGGSVPENLEPSFPAAIDTDCTFRPNSGLKTAFDPASDVNLDTGSSRNRLCNNVTDGSRAVIWEFSTFRIRSGVTVRIVGENPAILLVQGDVLIENGGRLLVRGDDQNGAPDGRGGNGQGYNFPTLPSGADGGEGVAGGGTGGESFSVVQQGDPEKAGQDGFSGYGSTDYDTALEEGGLGAGQGNVGATSSSSRSGSSPAGGGGGHTAVGFDGDGIATSTTKFDDPVRGLGGDPYPGGTDPEKMFTPRAGSGGGAGGENRFSFSRFWEAPAGAGGAGGGFVDITSGGDIRIFGVIDAAGGRGGNGSAGGSGRYIGAGGGGGGSGGGIRLLTPNDIDLTGGTITVAGGQGGTGGVPTFTAVDFLRQDGGAGSPGAIVMEDGDSIITGIQTAQVLPGEGQDGFYRGPFDPTRFRGGGLEPVVVTDLILLGPVTKPTFLSPVAADFVAGIPPASSNGPGATSMLLEVRGYPMLPDGTADLGAPTGWFTAGYFTSTVTGAAFQPEANPGDLPIPPDNMGVGMANIDGSQFVQVRIHFLLPTGISATQPGPFIDDWTLRFEYDN